MSSAADRAAERLRRFAERHGDAVRLARLAALAVRVDGPLLRALRLRFLPATDAGIEGDLWFSPLTESMSSQGFVLAPEVAAILRRDLAAEKVGVEQRALDAAAGLIEAAHRDWPPSLRLEERITWLALKDDPGAVTEIEALLRRAAKAMAEDEERGRDVARWALRALPRLPPAARATGAAVLLALGAADRLGGRAVLAVEEAPGAALADAAWILSRESLAGRTKIGLRRFADGFEFVDAAATSLTLELPETTPLVVQLSWSERGRRETMAIGVRPGRKVAIPPTASDIRIRTIAGDEWGLETTIATTAAAPEAAEPPADAGALVDAAVAVEFRAPGAAPDASPEIRAMGFFVASDRVLTLVSLATVRAEGVIRTVPWTVRHASGSVAATVEAFQSGLVLLRLSSPIDGARVLRRFDTSGLEPGETGGLDPGASWQSVFVAGSGSAQSIEGRLIAMEVRELRGGVPQFVLELAADPAQMMAGAPVVIGGRVVGIVTATRSSDQPADRVLALAASEFNEFVERSLRPAAPGPSVYVVYSRPPVGQGEYSAAVEGLERLKKALHEAGVEPWIDEGELGRGDDWLAQTLAAFNDSAGAAALLTPGLLWTPDTSHRQLLMVEYRFWAKRDYPVALFELQRGQAKLTDLFAHAELIALDSIGAAELASHLQRTYERVGYPHDVAARESGVEQDLAELLLSGARAESGIGVRQAANRPLVDIERTVDLIRDHGLFADVDWPAWLRQDPDASGAAVIEIAAMFTVPAETAQLVRDAAAQPPGRRAVALSTMPVNIARALIARAWIGEAAPVSLVFREQDWPEFGSTGDAPHVVAAEIRKVLDCDDETARWLLQNVTAPIFLIFATRPLPPRAYLEALQRALPHAVLFFLCGQERPDPPLLEGGLLTELAPLGEGVDMKFLMQYKRLMEMAAPRGARGTSGGEARRAARKVKVAPGRAAGDDVSGAAAPPGSEATRPAKASRKSGVGGKPAPERKSAKTAPSHEKGTVTKAAKKAPPKRPARRPPRRVLRKK